MVSIAGDSIIGILGTILAIALLIANAFYLNAAIGEIDKPNSNVNLSSGVANVLLILNVILIIILFAYLFYNIWRIFTTPERRAAVQQQVQQQVLMSRGNVAPPTGGVVVERPATQTGVMREYHTQPEAQTTTYHHTQPEFQHFIPTGPVMQGQPQVVLQQPSTYNPGLPVTQQ